MIKTQQDAERAILVHVEFSNLICHEELQEFQDLAQSAGVEPVALFTFNRAKPDAKYFLGSGKVEEIHQAVLAHGVELIIVNHALSPAQERNLERTLKCRVLDRITLILDIFAQRARTFEGKLQVELAQLTHLSTRLVRGWTHLERQKGGIGLRGPGETQLETDRRLLRNRIKTLLKRLDKVRSQRQQGRQSRSRSLIPTISFVGYTNAGKSTLFNALTGADVYAADQLFATLDPTLRRVQVTNYGPAILVDTVGFIRHLPHDLVDAFRATLEETKEADLLVHVVDAANSQWREQRQQVEAILQEIGAEKVPILTVFNKVDLLSEKTAKIERNQQGKVTRVWVSALQCQGFDLLLQAISEMLSNGMVEKLISLTPDQGKIRAKLYQGGYVLAERQDEEGIHFLKIRMPKVDYLKLFH